MATLNAWDREEEELCRRYERGEIDIKQYNFEMREIQRDYAAAMEEAAEDAYMRERERW